MIFVVCFILFPYCFKMKHVWSRAVRGQVVGADTRAKDRSACPWHLCMSPSGQETDRNSTWEPGTVAVVILRFRMSGTPLRPFEAVIVARLAGSLDWSKCHAELNGLLCFGFLQPRSPQFFHVLCIYI